MQNKRTDAEANISQNVIKKYIIFLWRDTHYNSRTCKSLLLFSLRKYTLNTANIIRVQLAAVSTRYLSVLSVDSRLFAAALRHLLAGWRPCSTMGRSSAVGVLGMLRSTLKTSVNNPAHIKMTCFPAVPSLKRWRVTRTKVSDAFVYCVWNRALLLFHLRVFVWPPRWALCQVTEVTVELRSQTLLGDGEA